MGGRRVPLRVLLRTAQCMAERSGGKGLVPLRRARTTHAADAVWRDGMHGTAPGWRRGLPGDPRLLPVGDKVLSEKSVVGCMQRGVHRWDD